MIAKQKIIIMGGGSWGAAIVSLIAKKIVLYGGLEENLKLIKLRKKVETLDIYQIVN